MSIHLPARRTKAPRARPAVENRTARTVPLSVLLSQWQEDGIISFQQAARMRVAADVQVYGDTGVPPEGSTRSSLVVEALGYLGGVIIVAASMLISAQYWDDIGSAWRLVLLGGVSAALLACGAAVPRRLDAVGDRLRAVLWLGSTGSCSGFLAVLAAEPLDLDSRSTAVLVASGTAAYATGLWLTRHSAVQQLAMMVALAMTAGAVIARLDIADGLPGIGVCGLGLVWALFGWGGLLLPRRLGLVFGSATAIIGAMMTGAADAGMVLTLVIVCGVVAVAVLARDLMVLGVGTVGVLVNIPAAVTKWFPDTMAAPYALLVVGAGLVMVALRIARRRTPESGAAPGRDYAAGSPGAALAAAGGVVTAVVATVATVAWL